MMMLLSGVSSDWAEALSPPNTFDRVRHLEAYIRTDDGKKSSRRIFNSVPFTQYETELLSAFHNALVSSSLDIPDCLKMIYHAKLDPFKAAESSKEHISWRIAQMNEPMPSQNSSFLFCLGKDKQFRPILYIRLQVMKNKSAFGLDESITYENIDKAIDWYLCLVRDCCFKRYFIENWVMILDCEGLSVFGFPVKFFTQLMKIMQLNHAATMHKMFILNPPTGFGTIFAAAKGFMSPDTFEKISMLSKSEFSQMQEVIEPNNLLEEYGGNLKRPSMIWPPPRQSAHRDEYQADLGPQNKEESAHNKYVYEPGLLFATEHPMKHPANPSRTRPAQTEQSEATQEAPRIASRGKPSASDGLNSESVSVGLSEKGLAVTASAQPQPPRSLLDKPAAQEPQPASQQMPSRPPDPRAGTGEHLSATQDKLDTGRSFLDEVRVQPVPPIEALQRDPLGLFPSETQGLNTPEHRGLGQQSPGPPGARNAGCETARKADAAKPKSWCAACCEQCNLI